MGQLKVGSLPEYTHAQGSMSIAHYVTQYK